jgi:hypothetical protein
MHHLFLRVLVSHFGRLVRFLAVLMSAGIVLLRLIVFATFVMMRRFSVVVRCGLMFSCRQLMVLSRFVLGFHWHLKFLLKNEVPDVAGQSARLVAATNFPLLNSLR